MARVYNPFAKSYVESLPINPYLRDGLPDVANPYKVATSPNLQKVSEAGANYYFTPYEDATYRNSIEPKLLEYFQNRGILNENMSKTGMLNSSTNRIKQKLLQIMSQRDINQSADTINAQIEQQRQQEIAVRKLNELKLLKLFQDAITNTQELPSSYGMS